MSRSFAWCWCCRRSCLAGRGFLASGGRVVIRRGMGGFGRVSSLRWWLLGWFAGRWGARCILLMRIVSLLKSTLVTLGLGVGVLTKLLQVTCPSRPLLVCSCSRTSSLSPLRSRASTGSFRREVSRMCLLLWGVCRLLFVRLRFRCVSFEIIFDSV